jgi:hypothetical protein
MAVVGRNQSRMSHSQSSGVGSWCVEGPFTVVLCCVSFEQFACLCHYARFKVRVSVLI